MDMDDLERMGISFDQEENAIIICQEPGGEEQLRIQLPPGADVDQMLAALVDQIDQARIISCAEVREDIDLVDDALMDMIENDDPESTQVAINALAVAAKSINLLMDPGQYDDSEQAGPPLNLIPKGLIGEEHISERITQPLTQISKDLLLAQVGKLELGRDDMIGMASKWLTIRGEVEAILDQIQE